MVSMRDPSPSERPDRGSAPSVRRLVPRLLAGRRTLTRVEKDQIFEAVLQGVDSSAPRRRRAAWLAVAGAVAALAAIPVVLLAGKTDSSSPFSARGEAVRATFAVFCAAGTCRPGDTLLFDVPPTSGWRYFTAFGRRDDGTVIWYFTDAVSASGVDLASPRAGGVLGTGVALDEAHRPGRYRIYGVFSLAPLDRAGIRARLDGPSGEAGAATDIDVVIRELIIQ